MKKVLVLIGLSLMLSGYSVMNQVKHIESNLIGLNRTITLYNGQGGIIKQWHTRSKVEDKGGTCYFLVDRKAIIISGTFVIEEI